MFDSEEERQYLAIADRRIAEAEDQIKDLLSLIQARKIEGKESGIQSDLLLRTHEVLETLRSFRSQVLQRLKEDSDRSL